MGGSDFRQPPLSSSLLTLVRECVSATPTGGSPWLPRNLYVRLDTAWDPGVASVLRPYAHRTVACWPINTIGLPQCGLFGALHLQGQHHLLPLHLATSSAYASISLLPDWLQGWIPGPWLAVTWAGFAPARLRDIAKPLLMGDPVPLV